MKHPTIRNTRHWTNNREGRGIETSRAGRGDSLRIVVVEDDVALRETVFVPGLLEHGFQAVGVGSAAELYRRMLSESFDMIVLDVRLPDESGFEIARHLRASSSVGIVMLTAHGDIADRVRGLANGADAYLHKPVELELLVATLESLARRMNRASKPLPTPTPSWRMEAEGWRLVAPNRRTVNLSLSERCILRALWNAAGEPVVREHLISCLTDDVYDFDPHRLEMMVYRLRRKVIEETGLELPLRAVRGQGYVLTISTKASQVEDDVPVAMGS